MLFRGLQRVRSIRQGIPLNVAVPISLLVAGALAWLIDSVIGGAASAPLASTLVGIAASAVGGLLGLWLYRDLETARHDTGTKASFDGVNIEALIASAKAQLEDELREAESGSKSLVARTEFFDLLGPTSTATEPPPPTHNTADVPVEDLDALRSDDDDNGAERESEHRIDGVRADTRQQPEFATDGRGSYWSDKVFDAMGLKTNRRFPRELVLLLPGFQPSRGDEIPHLPQGVHSATPPTSSVTVLVNGVPYVAYFIEPSVTGESGPGEIESKPPE